jgi:hypothetical protein
MKPKSSKNNMVTIVVLVILALAAWGLKKCKNSRENYPERQITTEQSDWRHHKLVYTSHARCRMECREITEAEVEFVLANGIINEQKSKEENEEAAGHCPTFAVEADTKDGQHVRVVFGACEKITKVITAIDLEDEHLCNCR